MYPKRTIIEDIGECYKLKGDNFWYKKVIGSGYDIPLIIICPSNNNPINPRVIESKRQTLSGLIKRLKSFIQTNIPIKCT